MNWVIIGIGLLAASAGNWSVTRHRPEGTKAGPHDYYSSAVFHANGEDMDSMCEAVVGLASSGKAGEVSRVLRVWFLDPATYMNTDLDFAASTDAVPRGRGLGVIESKPLIRCVSGIRAAEQQKDWDRKVGYRVQGWFRRYVCWLMLSGKSDFEKNAGGEHSAWWAAQVATYADYVNDERALEEVWKMYREGKAHPEASPEADAVTRQVAARRRVKLQ